MEFSLTLHANHPGDHELCLLFVFREVRHHVSFHINLVDSISLERRRCIPVRSGDTPVRGSAYIICVHQIGT